MSVMCASVFTPAPFPTRTSESASRSASARVFMKAPEPHFTSSTSRSIPSASFLERMEAVMSEMFGTVAVSFRRA